MSTDQELLVRAKRGGTEGIDAYGELVRRHQQWVVRLLCHLTRVSHSEAEDIAQEAFVRTFTALDRIDDGTSIRAWLRVVSTRLAYNHIREKRTRRSYTDMLKPEHPVSSVPPGPAIEAREALTRTLESIPYAHREILVLRHVEEMKLEDIAKLLDLGLSATKMRLSRARQAFIEGYEALTNEEHAR